MNRVFWSAAILALAIAAPEFAKASSPGSHSGSHSSSHSSSHHAPHSSSGHHSSNTAPAVPRDSHGHIKRSACGAEGVEPGSRDWAEAAPDPNAAIAAAGNQERSSNLTADVL